MALRPISEIMADGGEELSEIIQRAHALIPTDPEKAIALLQPLRSRSPKAEMMAGLLELGQRAREKDASYGRQAPPPDCSRCDDKGHDFVERGGYRYAVRCRCRFKAEIKARKQRAGIPVRYRDANFANYELWGSASDQSEQTRTVEACKIVTQELIGSLLPPNQGQPMGLVLYGPVGRGKSHLASAIANEAIEQGLKGVHFAEAETLMMAISQAIAEDRVADVTRPLYDSSLLVLDDCNPSKGSEAFRGHVSRVIHHRYNRRKPLLITTNEVGGHEQAETLFGHSSGSRLLECYWQAVGGGDYRSRYHKSKEPAPVKAASVWAGAQ